MRVTAKVCDVLVREHQVPPVDAKRITETFLRRFRRCPEKPRMSLDEWRILLWIESLGEDYEDLAEVIYCRWRKYRYRYLAPAESTTNLLRSLHKQYQLALVSNGPSQSQWEKIRELKLEEHFDSIIVSGDLKWEKPQPEIFHRACTSLGVEPFECLMIGDRIDTDIVGGLGAQIGITVWVSPDEPGADPPSPPPDFIVNDVSQIKGILQGGNEKKAKGLHRTKPKTSTTGASSGAGAAGADSSTPHPTPSTSTKVPVAGEEVA